MILRGIQLLLLLVISSCQTPHTPKAEILHTPQVQSPQNSAQRSLSNDDAAIKKYFETNQFENEKKHKRLVDYTPYKYEVLFTNPECGVYKYKTPIESIGGKTLFQKPENVFCKNKYDRRRSGQRNQSPQFRLIEWIKDSNTKEIFFTYLSFRNEAVKEALCEVAKKGVKIRFVISKSERPESDYMIGKELVACSPENVQMKVRGFEGDLKYAHNKFLIINPRTKDEFKIVFSSGNMTSGPVIHHENWNFITTHAASYFAQSHLCAAFAEWDDVSGTSRPEYIKTIKSCRAEINAEEETDIKVFFIPGEGVKEDNAGKRTATEYLLDGDGQHPGILNAKKIWLACHRFFYNTMINALDSAVSFKKKPETKAELRIIADDDTYYVANDPAFHAEVQKTEWQRMSRLQFKGAKIKFMETNSNEGQIHHSKFLIFADKNKNSKDPVDDFTALFTGSANLTGAGFKDNWENSYYITIPEVVRAFATQYVYTWDKLATEAKDLPKTAQVIDNLIDEPIIKTAEQLESENK